MSHHALLEYVRKAKACGASDADISVRLCNAGWYRVDVNDALMLYEKLNPPMATVARAISRVEPRKASGYNPLLVGISVASFIIGFLGFIWLTHY